MTPLPTHWNRKYSCPLSLQGCGFIQLKNLLLMLRAGTAFTQPLGMDHALVLEINRRLGSPSPEIQKAESKARRRGPRRTDDVATCKNIADLREKNKALRADAIVAQRTITNIRADRVRATKARSQVERNLESNAKELRQAIRSNLSLDKSLQETRAQLDSERKQAEDATQRRLNILSANAVFASQLKDVERRENNAVVNYKRLVRQVAVLKKRLGVPLTEAEHKALPATWKGPAKLPALPAVWTTARGKRIPITQLGDHHLGRILVGNFHTKDPLMEEAILREVQRRSNLKHSSRISTLFNKRVNGLKSNNDVSPAGLDWADDQADIDYSAEPGTGKTGGVIGQPVMHKFKSADQLIGFATGGIVEPCKHDFIQHYCNEFLVPQGSEVLQAANRLAARREKEEPAFEDYAKNPDNYTRTEEVDGNGMLHITVTHKNSPQHLKAEMNKLAEQGTDKFNQLQAQVDKLDARSEALGDLVMTNTERSMKLQTAFHALQTLVGPGWKTAEGYVRSIYQLSSEHLNNILEGNFGTPEIQQEIAEELERRKIDDKHQTKNEIKVNIPGGTVRSLWINGKLYIQDGK